MKKTALCAISFIFCLITIFTVLSNQTIQVNYDVKVAATGGIMSTENFNYYNYDLAKVREIIILLIIVIMLGFTFIFFLSSSIKKWDEKEYNLNKDNIPEYKKEDSVDIIFSLIFYFFIGGLPLIVFVIFFTILREKIILVLGLKSAAAKNLIFRLYLFTIFIGIIVSLLLSAQRPHRS